MSTLLDLQIQLSQSRLTVLRKRCREQEAYERKHRSRTTKLAFNLRRNTILYYRLKGETFKAIGSRLNITSSRAREILRKKVGILYNRHRPPMVHLTGESWQATNCHSQYCRYWPKKVPTGINSWYCYSWSQDLTLTLCSTNLLKTAYKHLGVEPK